MPLNAVAYLKENGITGNTFTDPNIWGGYLIWETPSNPVYIDGRIDMYGDEFMREYLGIIRGITRWQEPVRQVRRADIAIVSPTSVMRLQLEQSAQWQQVYHDEMAVVFHSKEMISHKKAQRATFCGGGSIAVSSCCAVWLWLVFGGFACRGCARFLFTARRVPGIML